MPSATSAASATSLTWIRSYSVSAIIATAACTIRSRRARCAARRSAAAGGAGRPSEVVAAQAHGWSFSTLAALSRRNFGHTSSLNPTFGISVMIRSSDRPIGKYPA